MTNEPMTNDKEVELRVALALAQKDAAEAKAEAIEARREVRILQRRIVKLAELSGLMSESVFTRAFTVWGYYLLATLTASIPIGLVMWVASELIRR